MLYLLDASSLITAQDTYYSIDSVPEFWSWLEFHAELGNCKVPRIILEEITPIDKKFKQWLKANRHSLVLNEEATAENVRQVVSRGYGLSLSEVDMRTIGNDPFLIAPALVYKAARCVVTEESSRPNAKGSNRKIPDVCKDLEVECISTVQFVKRLGFRTNWKDEFPNSKLFQ